MIICFSGTGNSLHVAEKLQDILSDEILNISSDKLLADVSDGRVIWVFPIHGWGMPKAVERAIKTATLNSADTCIHYMVCTCGDDIGMADKLWKKLLDERGWQPGGAFSVQMPNTYICLPGFDVDSPQLEADKLEKMPERVVKIASIIQENREVTDVVRGACAWAKSYVLRPPFMKYYTSPKLFTTDGGCVGCGKCSKECPMGAITMEDKKPVWNDKCTMCLRCYHTCHYHAIDYCHATAKKGQYIDKFV